MRRVLPVCLSTLALFAAAGAANVVAQQIPPTTAPTTTAPTTTTTLAPVTPSTSTSTTITAKPKATTTTTSTTAAGASRGPTPPPAAGPSQTLVPDLLGSSLTADGATTLVPVATPPPTTLVTGIESAASPIAVRKTSPSGLTLILATVAWLASLAALLVYAEDRRSGRWKHLAR